MALTSDAYIYTHNITLVDIFVTPGRHHPHRLRALLEYGTDHRRLHIHTQHTLVDIFVTPGRHHPHGLRALLEYGTEHPHAHPTPHLAPTASQMHHGR